ncbi:hypothetical protein, partial [Companilactobacillus halodurans]|uniref:hypothetical protein n=1 Tax=Companilactobacillus halodurans TaxID=2584183 RepID=UPI001EE234C3
YFFIACTIGNPLLTSVIQANLISFENKENPPVGLLQLGGFTSELKKVLSFSIHQNQIFKKKNLPNSSSEK